MGISYEAATLAGGCFWCTEAIFKRVKGVKEVIPGYSGGHTPNPTYQRVCTGKTGHAEAIQITYDTNEISYEELLDIFWHAHDPTTLNRQGNDVGNQYRSVIFYHDDKQKQIAEKSMKELDQVGTYKNPLVTQIVPFEKFYRAEDYHQNYYANNKTAPYCRLVIEPKLKKLLTNH